MSTITTRPPADDADRLRERIVRVHGPERLAAALHGLALTALHPTAFGAAGGRTDERWLAARIAPAVEAATDAALERLVAGMAEELGRAPELVRQELEASRFWAEAFAAG